MYNCEKHNFFRLILSITIAIKFFCSQFLMEEMLLSLIWYLVMMMMMIVCEKEVCLLSAGRGRRGECERFVEREDLRAFLSVELGFSQFFDRRFFHGAEACGVGDPLGGGY